MDDEVLPIGLISKSWLGTIQPIGVYLLPGQAIVVVIATNGSIQNKPLPAIRSVCNAVANEVAATLLNGGLGMESGDCFPNKLNYIGHLCTHVYSQSDYTGGESYYPPMRILWL